MKCFFSIKTFFLIIILLVLLSCTETGFPIKIRVYEGPPLPRHEVGIIRWGPSLRIVEIDGRKIKDIIDAAGLKDKKFIYRAFELPLGEHLIKVGGDTMVGTDVFGGQNVISITGEWLLKFKVTSRQSYRVEYKRGKRIDAKAHKVSVFIRNVRTDKIVSKVVEEKK